MPTKKVDVKHIDPYIPTVFKPKEEEDLDRLKAVIEEVDLAIEEFRQTVHRSNCRRKSE